MVSVTFITTPDAAQVYIDSADTLKITPVTIDLPEGTHTYTLKLPGFDSVSDTIIITTGYNYLVEVILNATSTDVQNMLNEKIVQATWLGVIVAAAGIIVTIISSRKKGG